MKEIISQFLLYLRMKNVYIIGVVVLYFFLSALGVQAREQNIALVIRPCFFGEMEFASRIVRAGENIGWKSTILDYQDKTIEDEKYDFVLSLVPEAYPSSHATYLALFDPKNHYFKNDGQLKFEYKIYDGYLVTYPIDYSEKSVPFFSFRPWIDWFPLVQFLEYKEVDPTHLFYVCCSWGSRAKDEKYKTFLKLLDQSSYAYFYGRSSFESFYPNSYKGPIPVDGESILTEIHNAGICLVLHSSNHLESAIPSGRIFEAIASSAVVISDKNPFVEANFGDAVFYVDQNSNGEDLFKQVEAHVNWIRTHKEESIAMAKKAYEIYREKFLLEDQLIRLEKWHDKITLED